MNHPAPEINYDPAEDIKTRYEILKQQQPEIRARNAAEELGVSEGELLAARVGDDAIRLTDDPVQILESLESLGELMGLTRNEYCVHERKGVYENSDFKEGKKFNHGLFVNPDIDLRLFMNHWKFNFAAIEQTRGGPRKSLQFFDKSGAAVHKIYLTSKSNEAEYDKLVEKFTAQNQPTWIDIEAYEPKPADKPDSEIDQEGLQKRWANLKDTHDFYPMLMKFKVGRIQAHRLVGKDYAFKVENDSARKILDLAGETQTPIMVFVGNRGMIQIHTGEVKKLVEHGPWYNVLDPKFNLHLREDKVATSWVTRKPTIDGDVNALELFDENGELIATFFGKRKPGIPELQEWRDILGQLTPLED